jgi:hypothetical protein
MRLAIHAGRICLGVLSDNWFRANSHLTLEEMKDGDKEDIEQRKEERYKKGRIEKYLGPQIFSFRRKECRDRDAGNEARQAQVRAQRKESDEPETGHRYRAFQGKKRGQEGSCEAVLNIKTQSLGV